MKVEAYGDEVKSFRGDAVVLFVYEEDFRPVSRLAKGLAGRVRKTLAVEPFKGKEGELLKVPTPGLSVNRVYLVGLGKREKAGEDTFRRAAAVAVRRLKSDRVKDALLVLPRRGEPGFELSKAVTEGLILGAYAFEKYKSGEKKPAPEKLLIYRGDAKGIKTGRVFAEAQNYARDLVNEPGNVINPVTLAKEAERLAKELGLECKVYDETQIKEMGMNALYAVGQGSATPPRFIHLTYKPKRRKAKEKVVLVGKGLTFDSGGLNVKPGDYMRHMKSDKSGACAVLAVLKAAAELNLPVELHGIIAAAENMPDGRAYRPDDIIKAKNGKFIEIDNTDAEGRVTMADALSYASELKPDKIIDLATLTGACIVALGEYTAGLFTNDERFGRAIKEAAKRAGERVWELPLDDERLRKKIKAPQADLLNTGGRYGGAITAAMFLQEFVGEGIPWVHLDVAGPAWSKEEYAYTPKGGTGFGVRTCLEYLRGVSS
ncbi:MAG: leucyl aminopeptidase [Aquificae bacterium]|nr:leucyl aminopeptidase [Aquificota bacterium]